MKYELITTDISVERTVMQDIVVDGIVTGQEATNEYEVNITLALKPTDEIIPQFSKTINVRSNNSMTGFEVDDQREQAIADYMQSINAVI